MSIEVYPTSQDVPLVKVPDPGQVNRVWHDFEPYRKQLAASAPPH